MYQLSDPWNDFSSEELQAITSKRGVGLDARDFMNIFSPNLPAGTVQENLCYLPLAFNFITEEACQSTESKHDSYLYDCWDNLLSWIARYKSDLIALNQYEASLIRVKQMIETLLAAHWELTQDVGTITQNAQLLIDAIGQDILLDIAPDYPESILKHFSSKSDRDCAIVLTLYDATLSNFSPIAKSRDLFLSLYPIPDLQERWLHLSARMEQLRDELKPEDARAIQEDLLDNLDNIL